MHGARHSPHSRDDLKIDCSLITDQTVATRQPRAFLIGAETLRDLDQRTVPGARMEARGRFRGQEREGPADLCADSRGADVCEICQGECACAAAGAMNARERFRRLSICVACNTYVGEISIEYNSGDS